MVWCAWASPGLAEDDASRSAARRLATAGVEAYQRDDYATATDKLERAYQILRVPSIGLWLARALAKQGRLVAAAERYLEVGRLPVTGDAAVQESAKKEAAAENEALTPQIPTIVVKLEGAEASEVTLELDGKPLPSAVVGEQQPVDPGAHQLKGVRGGQQAKAEVSLARSESKTVTLRFEGGAAVAAPSAAPDEPTAAAPTAPSDVSGKSGSSRKVLAWSAIGVGAAGLVLGGVTGGLAMSKKQELDDSPDCEGTVCLRSTMQDEMDSYATMRTLSSVGFIAGGVLAATGVVLLVTSPRSAAATRGTWVRVGATGVTAGGRF